MLGYWGNNLNVWVAAIFRFYAVQLIIELLLLWNRIRSFDAVVFITKRIVLNILVMKFCQFFLVSLKRKIRPLYINLRTNLMIIRTMLWTEVPDH